MESFDRAAATATLLLAVLLAAATSLADPSPTFRALLVPVQSGPAEAARPDPPVGSIFTSDDEVEQEIRNALIWNQLVDATRIHVDVELGVATLTGVVDTAAESAAAARIAAESGVRRVDNRLRIAP